MALSYKREKKNLALVFPSLYEARTFMDFLSQFADESDILFFPYDEVLRIEAISASKEMLKERLFALASSLDSSHKHIFIVNSVALIHEVSPLNRFSSSFSALRKAILFPLRI